MSKKGKNPKSGDDHPRVIGEGSYGCVVKPSLECKEPGIKLNYKEKVAKVMKSEYAKKEIDEYEKISEIDKKNKFLNSHIHQKFEFKINLDGPDIKKD
jgi:hypothetical protein